MGKAEEIFARAAAKKPLPELPPLTPIVEWAWGLAKELAESRGMDPVEINVDWFSTQPDWTDEEREAAVAEFRRKLDRKYSPRGKGKRNVRRLRDGETSQQALRPARGK